MPSPKHNDLKIGPHSNGTPKRAHYPYDIEIKVSKKIKSLRQLTKVEKELVKLTYKEAVLKCMALEDTQKYIALKIKIWVYRPCLDFLKKTEEEENREWYYRLVKDQHGFILHHKKSMDKIEQYEKELWCMAEDLHIKEKSKIKIFQQLHELTKTSVLLHRDLPFLTGLSRFYDGDILNKEEVNLAKKHDKVFD
jgi:hypothetical protein